MARVFLTIKALALNREYLLTPILPVALPIILGLPNNYPLTIYLQDGKHIKYLIRV